MSLPNRNPVPGLTRDLPVKACRPVDHEAPDQVRGGVAYHGGRSK